MINDVSSHYVRRNTFKEELKIKPVGKIERVSKTADVTKRPAGSSVNDRKQKQGKTFEEIYQKTLEEHDKV